MLQRLLGLKPDGLFGKKTAQTLKKQHGGLTA